MSASESELRATQQALLLLVDLHTADLAKTFYETGHLAADVVVELSRLNDELGMLNEDLKAFNTDEPDDGNGGVLVGAG